MYMVSIGCENGILLIRGLCLSSNPFTCHFSDFFTGSDSIQGTWCKDILQTIMSFTPHNWASHTLSCFPAPLQVIFTNVVH